MTEGISREALFALANEPIGGKAAMAEANRLRPGDKPSEALRAVAKRTTGIWLPKGRKPGSKLSAEEASANRSNAAARKALDRAATLEKRAKLLAYYATTDLSDERVAQHCGITVEEASKSLKALRRSA